MPAELRIGIEERIEPAGTVVALNRESVAAALELDGDTIKEARLAVGGVAHKPWRSSAAEAALLGQRADATAFTQAANWLLHGAKGYGHNNFKIGLARRAIVRALGQAARGTPQSLSDKKIR